MRSFSQLLDGWSTTGTESLLRNIRTSEDVENLFSKLEKVADKDGYISLDGIKTTVKKMREYVGTLHKDPVLRANGLYVAK